MWEPQPLATLWASMACNRDSFTFTLLYFCSISQVREFCYIFSKHSLLYLFFFMLIRVLIFIRRRCLLYTLMDVDIFISRNLCYHPTIQTFNKVPYQTLMSCNRNWFCFNSVAFSLLSYISIKISLIYNFHRQFLNAKVSPFITNMHFTPQLNLKTIWCCIYWAFFPSTRRAKFISYRWSVNEELWRMW
jgi:hypothetical protein